MLYIGCCLEPILLVLRFEGVVLLQTVFRLADGNVGLVATLLLNSPFALLFYVDTRRFLVGPMTQVDLLQTL